MTFGYGAQSQPDGYSEKVISNPQAEDCLIPMGITSENVASDFSVPRDVQDDFAAKSFQKAAKAQKEGKFRDEIVPITVKWVDPKTEEEKEITVDQDDGVREGVTKESLAKLRPAFVKNGTTHAGMRLSFLLSSKNTASHTLLGLKVTPPKSQMAPPLSSSPAAPSLPVSDSPSSANSSSHPPLVSPHALWVSAPSTPSPRY